MANRKQQRAYAARRHIQTEINRRLFRAFRVAHIMHINMLHERSHALSNMYSAAVFSYLAAGLPEGGTHSLNSGHGPAILAGTRNQAQPTHTAGP